MWKKDLTERIEPKALIGIISSYLDCNKAWNGPLKNPFEIPNLPTNPNLKIYDKPDNQSKKEKI